MCTGTLGILQVAVSRALFWSILAFQPSPFILLLAVHQGLPDSCCPSPQCMTGTLIRCLESSGSCEVACGSGHLPGTGFLGWPPVKAVPPVWSHS